MISQQQKRRYRQGVTLIELLIVMAIMGVVGTAIATVWMSSERTYHVATDLADAQARARIAMQQLEREVRSGSRGSLDGAKVPSELDFDTLKPDTETLVNVRYYRDADGNLVRNEGGTERRVASDVSEFSVVAATGETITVRLIIQVRDRRAVLETLVAFRNP